MMKKISMIIVFAICLPFTVSANTCAEEVSTIDSVRGMQFVGSLTNKSCEKNSVMNFSQEKYNRYISKGWGVVISGNQMEVSCSNNAYVEMSRVRINSKVNVSSGARVSSVLIR